MKAATLEAALIAHAPDAVLFVDCTGVIRLWNRGAETLFGYSAAEAIGHTLDLIVPEPMRPAHWAGFYRAVQQGRFTKDTELQTSRALTKDGRIIAVELSAAIIWSTAGHVRGIMAIGRDVTERRAHEQAQQERLTSLERQVTALKSQSNHHPRIRARRGAGAGRRACDSAAGRLAGSDRRPSHRRSPELLYRSVEKMEMEFIGELVFLLKTFFFVFLGISMRPADLWSPAAFTIVGLLLLVRFVMVRFSLPGMISSAADGSIAASLIPKGLAAAVMAAAAAGEPGFPKGNDVDSLIYAVILFSIATTALLVFLFEKTQLHRVFSGWWIRHH